jgi:hypothetical protein
MRADLESLQELFANALIDLNMVEPALVTFKGSPELNRERFAFYRGNIAAIWQQSCANAYPVLQQLLGIEFFGDLTRAYGLAHPSQSGNLTEFGAAMPGFIGTLENCRAYPYLKDVAALEWLVHRAYYLKHEDGVTLTHLAAVPSEHLGDVQCQLQPGCFLFKSPWSISDIWQAHQKEAVIFPDDLTRKTYCLVWRQDWQAGWKVQVSHLSAASYQALQALKEGETLGTAFEKALEEDPEFAVQTELADWFHKQLLISITTNKAIT